VNANLGVEIPEPVGRGEVVEERVWLRLRAGRGARSPGGERVVVVVNSHQLLHFLRRPACLLSRGFGSALEQQQHHLQWRGAAPRGRHDARL
jgi:hypothetical protein